MPEPYRYEPGPEVISEDYDDDVIGDNFDDGKESLQYQRDLYIDDKGKLWDLTCFGVNMCFMFLLSFLYLTYFCFREKLLPTNKCSIP